MLHREQGRLVQDQPLAIRERRRRTLQTEVEHALNLFRAGDHSVLPQIWILNRNLRNLRSEWHLHARSTHIRCGHMTCGGLLDAGDGTCIQCNRVTCQHCGSCISDGASLEDHECDPDAVASQATLRRECRPCAGCGALSYRTEGCPIMWCLVCHRFWHWNTGRLVVTRHGLPHNPDHRAWVATGRDAVPQREIDDIPCGGLPTIQDVHLLTIEALRRSVDCTIIRSAGMDVVMATASLQEAQALRHSYRENWDMNREAQSLRLSFLMGDISEAKFAKSLEKLDRNLRVRREVALVLEGMVLAGADLLQVFAATIRSGMIVDCRAMALQLGSLRGIFDDSLQQLEALHARKLPRLSANWIWRLPHRR